MSKRFGRNQKRKLKQELENQKEALKMANGLNDYLSKNNNKNVDMLQNVRRVLGEYTALLDPQTQNIEASPRSDLIELARVARNQNMFAYPGDQAINDYSLHRDVLYLLNFVKHDDPLNLATHLEFRYKDGKVGYAISEQAMQNLPEDYLAGQIANEMAKMLVQNYRKKSVLPPNAPGYF